MYVLVGEYGALPVVVNTVASVLTRLKSTTYLSTSRITQKRLSLVSLYTRTSASALRISLIGMEGLYLFSERTPGSEPSTVSLFHIVRRTDRE